MKKTLHILTFLCLGAAGGWTARSLTHRGPWHGLHASPGERVPTAELPPHLDQMLSAAGISDEQRQQIHTVYERHLPDRKSLHENIVAARKDFEGALDAEANTEALSAKFQALLAAKHNAELEHFDLMLETRALLSTEQRQKLRDQRRSDEMRPPGGAFEP